MIRHFALAFCLSMVFFDLPCPPKLNTEGPIPVLGFAQAGNRRALFGIVHLRRPICGGGTAAAPKRVGTRPEHPPSIGIGASADALRNAPRRAALGLWLRFQGSRSNGARECRRRRRP